MKKGRHPATRWLLEIASILAVCAAFAVLAWYWNKIPAIIPTHFDVHGRANKLGSKHFLAVLAVIDLATYVLLSFATRYQKLVNLPIKLDRNVPAVKQQIGNMVAAIKAITTVSFLYIIWMTIQTAIGHANGLGPWFLIVFSGATVLVLGFYIVSLRTYQS